MKHSNQFQPFQPNPIRNDIGSVLHYELASTGQSAGPSNFRMSLQKIDGFKNAPRGERRSLLGTFRNVLPQSDQMAYRPAGPDDLHRGAFVSPGLPQEFSHFDTFSWLTPCPASSSASPAWISPSCHSSDSMYAPIASAARKDFERLDLLARASNRSFVPASIRMERVSDIDCAPLYTSSHKVPVGPCIGCSPARAPASPPGPGPVLTLVPASAACRLHKLPRESAIGTPMPAAPRINRLSRGLDGKREA